MTLTDMADVILQKVLETKPHKDYVISGQKDDGGFLVIPGNGAPRWIVPGNASLGAGVLAQWTPYGFGSQIKWYLLRLFYVLKCMARVPGITRLAGSGRTDAANKQTVVAPVIYVGTPGPQQKIVVTLVDVSNGQALAVMKLALGVDASTSILREANTLKLLSDLGVKNTPKLIALDKDAGYTWQAVVSGKLAARHLNSIQVDWLLSLPKTGKTTTFNEQKERLCRLIDNERNDFSNRHLELITKSLEGMNSDSLIPFVLAHGDFAPWNLKQKNNGECAVIDWEDADVEGLPLWDLCHFSFIQAHLFNEHDLVKDFISDRLTVSYLKNVGIATEHAGNLIVMYILFMALSKDRNTSPEYRAFLVDQIPVVLAR